MRLSAQAFKLLEENSIITLQNLPLNQLVSDFDGEANSVCFRLTAPREAEASTFAGTAAINAPQQPNPVELLVDPVVIASGYIFSRDEIQARLTHENPTCPVSGVLLANKRVTPLPQVDLALQLLRYEISQPYAFDYQAVSRFDAQPNVNTLQVNVSANVSVNRIQLKLSGENVNLLRDLLASIFAGKNNCVTGQAYRASPWSIVWASDDSSAQIMLRYPTRAIANEQIAFVVANICQLISTLPFNQDPDEIVDTISIDQVGDDDYPTIVEEQSIQLRTAVKIVLTYLMNICEIRQVLAPNDTVFDDDVEIIPDFVKRRRLIGCFNFAGGANPTSSALSSTIASSGASQTPSYR